MNEDGLVFRAERGQQTIKGLCASPSELMDDDEEEKDEKFSGSLPTAKCARIDEDKTACVCFTSTKIEWCSTTYIHMGVCKETQRARTSTVLQGLICGEGLQA